MCLVCLSELTRTLIKDQVDLIGVLPDWYPLFFDKIALKITNVALTEFQSHWEGNLFVRILLQVNINLNSLCQDGTKFERTQGKSYYVCTSLVCTVLEEHRERVALIG